MMTFWAADNDPILPSYVLKISIINEFFFSNFSKTWDNVDEFFNDVKPPMFENYTIIVMDVENCFEGTEIINFLKFSIVGLILFLMLF